MKIPSLAVLPKPTYGPSSAHSAVAIVAMGDGSVMGHEQALRR